MIIQHILERLKNTPYSPPSIVQADAFMQFKQSVSPESSSPLERFTALHALCRKIITTHEAQTAFDTCKSNLEDALKKNTLQNTPILLSQLEALECLYFCYTKAQKSKDRELTATIENLLTNTLFGICPEGDSERLHDICAQLSADSLSSKLSSLKYQFIQHEATQYVKSKVCPAPGQEIHCATALRNHIAHAYGLPSISDHSNVIHYQTKLLTPEILACWDTWLCEAWHTRFLIFSSETLFKPSSTPTCAPKIKLAAKPQEPVPNTLYITLKSTHLALTLFSIEGATIEKELPLQSLKIKKVDQELLYSDFFSLKLLSYLVQDPNYTDLLPSNANTFKERVGKVLSLPSDHPKAISACHFVSILSQGPSGCYTRANQERIQPILLIYAFLLEQRTSLSDLEEHFLTSLEHLFILDSQDSLNAQCTTLLKQQSTWDSIVIFSLESWLLSKFNEWNNPTQHFSQLLQAMGFMKTSRSFKTLLKALWPYWNNAIGFETMYAMTNKFIQKKHKALSTIPNIFWTTLKETLSLQSSVSVAQQSHHLCQIIISLQDYTENQDFARLLKPLIDFFSAHRPPSTSFQHVLALLGSNPDYKKCTSGVLLTAIAEKDAHTVRLLLSHNAIHPNDVFCRSISGLHLAVYTSQQSILTSLLQAKADPNKPHASQQLPLFLAVQKEQLNITSMLLDANANPNIQDPEGNTPLMLACNSANLALTENLITHGADPKAQRKNDLNTCLHIAVSKGEEKLVSLLLEHHALIDIINTQGNTPLQMSLLHDGSQHSLFAISKLLLEKKANPNLHCLTTSPPLLLAAHHVHTTSLKDLLNAHANVNASRQQDHMTALHVAVDNDRTAAVVILLKANADFTITTTQSKSNEKTPLSYAVEKDNTQISKLFLTKKPSQNLLDQETLRAADIGHIKTVEVLLEHGARVNCQTWELITPLHFACLKSNFALVKLLLQYQADPKHVSLKHTTPLFAACEKGHAGIATVLLAAKASPAIPTELWGNAEPQLSKAIEHGHDAIIELLTKALGAPLKQYPSSNNTLCLAVTRNSHSITSILLEAKACPDTAFLGTDSALTLAMRFRFYEIARLLLQHDANPNFLYPHSKENKLSVAIEHRNTLIIETLLEYHRKTIPLSHPLHTAIRTKQPDIICMLLRVKANPNEPFDFPAIHQYPLLLATESGNTPLISILLEYSANPNISDRHNWTPLHIAIYQGNLDNIRLLLTYKAQLHPTVLQHSKSIALKEGHHNVLALLESYIPHTEKPNNNTAPHPLVATTVQRTQTHDLHQSTQNTATQTQTPQNLSFFEKLMASNLPSKKSAQ